jgi:hypothetical protein
MVLCTNILQWNEVHECQQGFTGVTKNYSTCIIFLLSEETTELVNTIEEHEICVNSLLLLPSYSI